MKLSNLFKSVPSTEMFTAIIVSNAFKGNFDNKFVERKFATVGELNDFLKTVNYEIDANDIPKLVSGKSRDFVIENDKELIFFTRSKFLISREFTAKIDNEYRRVKALDVPKDPRLSFLVSLSRPANIQSVKITKDIIDSFHMSVKVK